MRSSNWSSWGFILLSSSLSQQSSRHEWPDSIHAFKENRFSRRADRRHSIMPCVWLAFNASQCVAGPQRIVTCCSRAPGFIPTCNCSKNDLRGLSISRKCSSDALNSQEITVVAPAEAAPAYDRTCFPCCSSDGFGLRRRDRDVSRDVVWPS